MTLAILFLIENNGVTPEWESNPFYSDSIVLNENRITSIDADAWCKRDLTVPECYVCSSSNCCSRKGWDHFMVFCEVMTARDIKVLVALIAVA